MVFEWRDKKALTAAKVMDPIYDYDHIETLYLKNMTPGAFFVEDAIDLSKYTNLQHFRLEQRFVSSRDPISDYDAVYCRKCHQKFPNVRCLHNHYYQDSCPEFAHDATVTIPSSFRIITANNKKLTEVRVMFLEGKFSILNLLRVMSQIKVAKVHFHVTTLLVPELEPPAKFFLDGQDYTFTRKNAINESRHIWEYTYEAYTGMESA